jgi:hypothetical protein
MIGRRRRLIADDDQGFGDREGTLPDCPVFGMFNPRSG